MRGQRVQKPRRRAAERELIANGIAHEIMQPACLAETDFGLGRVNVDVHLLRRHLEKQQHHRKRRGRENIAISLAHRVQQQAIAHQAAIDKAVDRVAIQFLQFRLGDETGDTQPAGLGCLVVRIPFPGRGLGQPGTGQLDFCRERKQLIERCFAENLEDALC